MSLSTVQTPVAGARRPEGSGRGTSFASIVVALDRSARAEQVLAYVETLARTFRSTVICISVVEPISTMVFTGFGMPGAYIEMEPVLDTEQEVQRADASYLADIERRLARRGIDVICEEPEGKAAEAIVASARAHHADLIAMTTHGRSGLGRAILGGVADEVIRTAPCPVLLVRLDPDE